MPYRNLIRISLCLSIFIALVFSITTFTAATESSQEIPHESGMYYTIQKGDTLWDLSKRFFDSPDQWPDLWKQNDEIPNPHWIYPGERIRIYRQEGIDKVKSPEDTTSQDGAASEKAMVPPPSMEEAEELAEQPPSYEYTMMNQVGFIRKEPVRTYGTIFRSQDDKTMISEGDIVYIRPGKHTILYQGMIYTIYRNPTDTRGKQFSDLVGAYGTQYYLVGVVEITKLDNDYSIGKVTRSYRDIRINDKLMAYVPRSSTIRLAESTEDVLGRILVNEDRDRMFGDNAIAFIDKGKKDGIKIGQFYNVFYEDTHGIKFKTVSSRDGSRRNALHTPVDFAKILVLHTEESTSTVLVTYSEKDLYPTARIRTPIK